MTRETRNLTVQVTFSSLKWECPPLLRSSLHTEWTVYVEVFTTNDPIRDTYKDS